jgi:hypothetical protein
VSSPLDLQERGSSLAIGMGDQASTMIQRFLEHSNSVELGDTCGRWCTSDSSCNDLQAVYYLIQSNFKAKCLPDTWIELVERLGLELNIYIQLSPPPTPLAIGKMMPQGGFGDFKTYSLFQSHWSVAFEKQGGNETWSQFPFAVGFKYLAQ